MRLFAAVIPPEDVVAELDEFLDVRREHGAFRWALPEQFHVTLAFLPEVADRNLDDLLQRVAHAAARRRAFDARLAGGVAFPHPGAAKVLASGVEAPEELTRLAAGARAAASASGVRVDGATFRPHLTVARLGRPIEATRWVRLLDAHRGPAWQVDEVALVQSHLGEGPRKRPRYEVLATVPLSPSS